VARPPNHGKRITDSLRTIKIEPETLDMYTEVSPLQMLPGVMSNVLMLALRIEVPKLKKRRKLGDYGLSVIKGLIRMNLWQPLFEKKVCVKRDNNLTILKQEIKHYAEKLGYLCGFTKVDRRFIAECRDDKFPFDTAVVLGMEMDKDLLDQVPYPGDRLFDFEVYVESGKRVFDVAEFIRSKGYRCFARIPFDGWVKYPPHAINAGLGELGALGVVITREFGPRVRWTMISVDAEIEPDSPVDLGMTEYCDACRLCIRACPGKAISDERVWWRGVFKRKVNDTKCWPFFVKYEGCGICLKVCPINRHGYNDCMTAYKKDGTIKK
jgi:Pyruvate/2-oxoacid:ferredoxin oxidoreductase delta subunit